MKQGIKRPLEAYFLHGLLIAVMVYCATSNSSEMGRWILWIATTAGMISLIHRTLKRNYFEIDDNKLIINEGIFQTKTIDLAKIEKFDIEPGPFTASKIVLRDKSTIKYSDSQTDGKKLKELMAQYNIPVE